MEDKNFIPLLKFSSRSFTLVELIIVIIIVGILAALGISQYSNLVEKSRLAEAKVRIGTMRQLVYEYYMNNGTLTGLSDPAVGVNWTCTPTSYYRFMTGALTSTRVNLYAGRCTSGSGGKTPNVSREYYFYLSFNPSTGCTIWSCKYIDDASPCFGFPVLDCSS